MEQKVKIPTPDNHTIYGTLNWQGPDSDSLIIFVHGLSGDQNRHLLFNSAKFFPQHGYTTFRFNLYDMRSGGRLLHESAIRDHSNDINTVVEHFADTYQKIYLIGHSLGGPSIIRSDQAVTAAVLWDPSLVLDKSEQTYWEEIPETGNYYLKGGTYRLISKAIHDEWANSGRNMLQYMKVPTKIICAGDGTLLPRWSEVHKEIPVPYEFTNIPGATHGFDEEGTEDTLFLETLEFIQKY